MIWHGTLAQPTPDKLGDHVASTEFSQEDWPILTAFCGNLLHYFSCFKEASRISSLLSKATLRQEWQDILSEAVTESYWMIEMARSEPSINDWFRDCLPRERPLGLDRIIPPLTLEHLVEFRKSIDKQRKRMERYKYRQPLPLHALIVAEGGIDELLTDEELTLAMKAVAQLPELDQEIWRLHCSGLTMREVGQLTGRSASTVSVRLAKAVERIARTLDKRTG